MSRSTALAALAAALLGGCTVAPPGNAPIETVRGSVPIRAATPLDAALTCLAAHHGDGRDLRLAVFAIPDKTGVVDYDGPGAYVTQGAELMMVAALAKAGVRQVNRTATNVAEWELSQAMQQRLGDGKPTQVGDQTISYRPVAEGVLLGSTHTIYGGITELDFDLLSDGAEVSVAGIGAKARGYYIGIALDLLVSDSATTELVVAKSYRKQLWGQELEANLFRFWDIGSGNTGVGDLGIELFDARIGQQKNEPVHAGVRWVVEQAAYDIVRSLTGAGAECDRLVPGITAPTETAPAASAAAPAAPVVVAAKTSAEPVPVAPLDSPAPSVSPKVRLPDGTALPAQAPSVL